MRIKTSELTGAPLNWAVATVMGLDIEIKYGVVHTDDDEVFMPDLDWNIVGFIIEREGIMLVRHTAIPILNCGPYYWKANKTDGPTPRIAALRCYVASKMGDEVEIPEELLI
jgi:hypothetical protein